MWSAAAERARDRGCAETANQRRLCNRLCHLRGKSMSAPPAPRRPVNLTRFDPCPIASYIARHEQATRRHVFQAPPPRSSPLSGTDERSRVTFRSCRRVRGTIPLIACPRIRPSVPIPKYAPCCGTLLANFGIERTQQVYNSSVVFGFEVPTRVCRRTIGTSNPPHWRPLSAKG